jgi:hypothetical protein
MPHDDTTSLDLLIAGIYIIRNKRDGAVYIGSSVNIYDRWAKHHLALVQGKHRNLPLREAWQRDGAAAFSWQIIERDITGPALVEAEQRWLDHYRGIAGQHVYNGRQVISRAERPAIDRQPMMQCPSRLAGVVRFFRDAPFPAPKTKAKHHKLTEDEVRAIRASVDPSTVLGERYGVSRITIGHVRTGKTWQHVPFDEGAIPRTWRSLREDSRRLDKRQVSLLLSAEGRDLLAALTAERGSSPYAVVEALIREAASHRPPHD